jgi:hypothetical protein
MAFIKSALEIALEKTENIKGDKAAIAAHASKEEGKKLASLFFANNELDLDKKFREFPADQLASVKAGFFKTVFTNLILPKDEADITKVGVVFLALEYLSRDKGKLKSLKQQLDKFLRQFIDDRKHLGEALSQQYAPILRKKEEQLARQVGRAVKLDPMSDPEYVKAYNQNIANLEAHYGDVLTQVKEEIVKIVGMDPEEKA